MINLKINHYNIHYTTNDSIYEYNELFILFGMNKLGNSLVSQKPEVPTNVHQDSNCIVVVDIELVIPEHLAHIIYIIISC